MVPISVYRVKPAVFDLLLAGGIAAYLFVVYTIVMHAASVVAVVRSVSGLGGKAHYVNGKSN